MPLPDTAPSVSAFTARVYEQLPEFYRTADEPRGFPLLRWLSLLGDQAATVETLLDRFSYTPVDDGGPVGDTSDLVDPAVADEAWLPWLGRLVGADVTGLTGQAARDAVAGAVNGFQVGTKAAVAAAARSALTGTRYVEVYDHSVTSPGDGGVWDVLLVTRSAETPDVDAVLAAVTAKGAKPAGVVLHHRAYTATWDAVEAAYPTWADIDGVSWQTLEETGL